MCYAVKKWKTNFFEHIDTKKISDNKTFWKTVKPFISNKCRSSENIILVKGDDTISDKGQVANIFNEFFANVVKNLNITINEDILSDTKAIDDPVLKAIEKYKKHPSIRAIKDISKNNTFSFQKVSYEEALKEIHRSK